MIIPAWFSTPSALSAVKSSSRLIPFRCFSADKKLPFVPLCLKSGGWCGDFPGSPLSHSGFPRPFVHCLHSKHKIFPLEVSRNFQLKLSFCIVFFCWLKSVKEPSGTCHSHLWVREMLRMFLLVGLWCVHGDSVCGQSLVGQRGPTLEVEKCGMNETSSLVLSQVWDNFCLYV